MTTNGKFKLFLNGKEVTEQEIRDCKENISVTINGLSVFYSFSPKIESEKTEADWINFTSSSMKRGKVFKYSRPIDKTICASDIINSEEKIIAEKSLERIDIRTIQLPKGFMNCAIVNNNSDTPTFVTDTNNSQNWQDIRFPLPKGNWNIEKYSDDFRVVTIRDTSLQDKKIKVTEKNKKETLNDKDKGILSTRHKSRDGEEHQQKDFFPRNPISDCRDKTQEVKKDYWVKPKDFFTEGIKESQNKVDYSEINLDILDLMANRFTANKHKYPKGNMKKIIDIKSLEWALFRHVKKMIQPIETDEESYKDHLSAVLCNASMILDQLKNQ